MFHKRARSRAEPTPIHKLPHARLTTKIYLAHYARRADPFWAGGNWVVASNQRAPKEMIGWDRYLESNMRPMLP